MYPIAIDLKRVPIFLIGEGEAFTRRKKQLEDYGAANVCTCSYEDWSANRARAQWQKSTVIMVVGLDFGASKIIEMRARTDAKLINVEDVTELCDFYFTSHIRRGDLMIAVSTGGASPTLAKKVRDVIAERFGLEWAERTTILKELRLSLKSHGAGMKEVMEKTEAFLREKGWFS